MNRLKFALAPLALALSLSGTMAMAQAVPAALSATSALLTVTAEGKTARTPDLAVFNAGVTSQGKTAGEALTSNAADMSRVIQGLIAGIGFLCAGTILKHGKDEQQVQGLTTAAGLWMTAAIGMACGLGRETTAVLSTLLAFTVLAVAKK